MSSPRTSLPSEGDAFSASSITTPLSTLEDAANDIEEGAVRRRSLLYANGPGSLRIDDPQLKPESTSGAHKVTQTYPGRVVAGWGLLDPSAGGTAGTSTSSDAADTTRLEIEFDGGAGIDLSGSNIHGVLIHGDVVVTNVYDDGGSAVSNFFACVVALQILDDGGTWHHVPRTERWCHSISHSATQQIVNHGVAVATLITEDDLGVGTKVVAGARMVAAVKNLNTGTLPTGTLTADIASGRLSAITHTNSELP